jgi:membrane-associated phospholipid phosphatase
LAVVAIFTVLFLVLWGLFIGAAPLIQHGLRYAAHWTAKFRYRDYLPVVLVLAAGVALTMFAGDAFLDLGELVQSRSPLLQEVDTRAHNWAASQRSAGATLFFTVFTWAGTPGVLTVAIAIVAIALAVRGRYRWAVFLVVTTGMGGLLVNLLKLYFARARPDLAEALRQAHGYSFPSGHAMGSTIVAGALAYLALRALPTWRTKAAGLAAAVTFVAAVALSRVYLGVHWISDIGAGVAAGLVWVTVTTIAYETFRRIRLVRALRSRS